jgi:hypothetical protein
MIITDQDFIVQRLLNVFEIFNVWLNVVLVAHILNNYTVKFEFGFYSRIILRQKIQSMRS